MRISVNSNLASAISRIQNLRRDQLPFATSLALNQTAKDVQQAEKDEIRTRFKAPTPYVQNSPRVKFSTKIDLQASVYIGGAVERSLLAQVEGGTRKQKPYERYLTGILPANWVVVPGKGAKIDQYGNMARSQLLQIVRTVRGSTRSKGDYFISSPSQPQKARNGGRLPYGIWQRAGRGKVKKIVNVLFFLPRADYPQRFKFYQLAKQKVDQKFAANFQQAYARAVGSAR